MQIYIGVAASLILSTLCLETAVAGQDCEFHPWDMAHSLLDQQVPGNTQITLVEPSEPGPRRTLACPDLEDFEGTWVAGEVFPECPELNIKADTDELTLTAAGFRIFRAINTGSYTVILDKPLLDQPWYSVSTTASEDGKSMQEIWTAPLGKGETQIAGYFKIEVDPGRSLITEYKRIGESHPLICQYVKSGD